MSTSGSFTAYVPVFKAFPEVERFLRAVSVPTSSTLQTNIPAINVWEDDEAFYLESELPGCTMSDLEITAVGDQLTIAGSRPPAGVGSGSYLRCERPTGGQKFSRSLRIGVPFQAESVEASLKNGVLNVKLPKAAAAKPWKIEIKAV